MTYPFRNPRAATRTIEGEAVAVSPDDAMLHNFNEVGTLIWELADGRHDLDAIADRVSATYDVGLAEARRDVEAFCSQLADRKILVWRDKPR